jgi:hypothetical protein
MQLFTNSGTPPVRMADRDVCNILIPCAGELAAKGGEECEPSLPEEGNQKETKPTPTPRSMWSGWWGGGETHMPPSVSLSLGCDRPTLLGFSSQPHSPQPSAHCVECTCVCGGRWQCRRQRRRQGGASERALRHARGESRSASHRTAATPSILALHPWVTAAIQG